MGGQMHLPPSLAVPATQAALPSCAHTAANMLCWLRSPSEPVHSLLTLKLALTMPCCRSRWTSLGPFAPAWWMALYGAG